MGLVSSNIKEYSLHIFPVFIFNSEYLQLLLSQSKYFGIRKFTLRYLKFEMNFD